MILTFALSAAIALATGDCETQEFVRLGMLASARLEEIAEKKGIPESDVGAVLILWRAEACDLLNGQPKLYEATQQAIENECRQIIILPKNDEAGYIRATGKALKEHGPDVISIAWAIPEASGRTGKHVFIVADGSQALRVSSPGYGREGDSESGCIPSPWALAASAHGG